MDLRVEIRASIVEAAAFKRADEKDNVEKEETRRRRRNRDGNGLVEDWVREGQ